MTHYTLGNEKSIVDLPGRLIAGTEWFKKAFLRSLYENRRVVDFNSLGIIDLYCLWIRWEAGERQESAVRLSRVYIITIQV